MATNVAEVKLENGGAVASACITDPLQVEGGSTVVLELRERDAWTLRDSLQQASFLRLPVLFTQNILLVQGGTVLRLGQALLAASPSLFAWAS